MPAKKKKTRKAAPYIAGVGNYKNSRGYGEFDKKAFKTKAEAVKFAKNAAKPNETAYVRKNGHYVYKAKKTRVFKDVFQVTVK